MSADVLADSCLRSVEQITSMVTDEPLSPETLRDLLPMCEAAQRMANTKDAYILADGAIGVVSRRNGVPETARMLVQFCARFPNATLKFITPADLLKARTMDRIIRLSSGAATSCGLIQPSD